MDLHNRNSASPDPGQPDRPSRDYPALCVFAGLVLALLAAGYFAIKSADSDPGFSPGAYVQEWTKGIEEKVKRLVGESFKGIKLPGRESADVKAHFTKGRRLHNQRSYQEALAEFNKAIEIDPRSAEVYYWRGRTLINLGKPGQGMEDFKTAVKLKPDYSDAYDILGWLAAKQGQAEEGIAYLTKSIALKPDNAWAFYNRSSLLFAKGDLAGAMRDAEKACSLGFQDGCKAYETYKNSSREGG